MTESIVLNLGLPFGHWSDLTAVCLDDSAHRASSMDALHREVMSFPPLDAIAALSAQALLDVRADPKGLSAWLADQGPKVRGSDARLCWTGPALADALPGAKFVVWVEHPARVLAKVLQAAAPRPEHSHALSLLQSAAQGMCQLVQRHAERCLVIELDEFCTQPLAFTERLSQWLSSPVPPQTAPGSPTDPVALALATCWVATESSLTRAHERLYASCAVPDAVVAVQTSSLNVRDTLVHALPAYAELAARGRGVELLTSRLQLAEKESARALQALGDTAQGNAELLVQLQQVQHELETSFLQGRGSDEQFVAARNKLETADAELKNLRALHAGLQAEHGRSAADLAKERMQAASLRTELGKLRDARIAAEKERDAARQESERLRPHAAGLSRQSELLLVQLQQVQEELEQYYLACKELEAAATLSDGGRCSVRVMGVELGAAHDGAPHRGLTLSLQGVSAADRACRHLRVRLVEHHGRAGLLLFDSGEGGKPMMAWESSGEEGGQPFMLLIPDDALSRQRMQHLGAGDWQFVRGLALCLALQLSEGRTGSPPRWAILAKRLVKNLADLPPRFRFDQIFVKADTLSPDAWMVTFQHVVFGDREVPTLALRWRPHDAAGSTIELQAPDDAGAAPLLACWPLQGHGEWSPVWRLPLGDAQRGANEQAWRAMSRNDRELLLGLLDAMPAAAMAIAATGNSGADRAQLATRASGMLREAHRLLYGSRLRRLLRAALGRLLP